MSSRDSLRELIGPSILNGEIRYFSVSTVTKAAPRAMGCYRRLFREKVLKIEPEKSKAAIEGAATGHAMHEAIENHLLTGAPLASAIALKGAHMIPPPGPGLLVEHPIHVIEPAAPGAPYGRPHSLLEVDGIPFVGFIDLLNFRGINYGGGNIEEMHDPPGTVEVQDWKWKRKAYDRYKNSLLKSPAELIYEIQMAGYGEWVRQTYFDAQHIRLSHAYFIEQGAPAQKVTKLHVVSDFEPAWKYATSVARTIRDIVRETDENKVPANVRACDAFGGCPHRETCEGYRQNALDAVFGKIAQDFKTENEMGLLSNLPQQPQVPPPAQPDMRAQLEAEEQRLRAAQPAAQQIVPSIADAIACIESHGRGFPQLSGAAATAYAQARGINLTPGAGLAGGGNLGGLNLTEPAHLGQLADELEDKAGRPKRFAVVPPPAPQPTPVQQVAQTMTYAPQQVAVIHNTQPTQVFAAPAVNPAAGGLLAPGAPASIPQLAAMSAAPQAPVYTDPTPTTTMTVTAAEEPKKRGRGRPPKTSDTAPVQQTAAPTGTPPAPPPSHGQAFNHTVGAPQVAAAQPGAVSTFSMNEIGPVKVQTNDSQALEVYVNCRPFGTPTVSLDPYVDMLNRELSKRYCVDAQGRPTIQDIRCAPKDSPLGYAGWKGAVHECVRTNPPPAQAYHFDVGFDELREIVADAMRVVCAETESLFVRGLR